MTQISIATQYSDLDAMQVDIELGIIETGLSSQRDLTKCLSKAH